MIKICFRFDDPSEISDHELEKRIIDLFVKHDAGICFAVIPYKRKEGSNNNRIWPLSGNNVRHIIEGVKNGTIDIAQHGYAHVADNRTPEGYPSEFSGEAHDRQTAKILAGRKHLIDVFQSHITGFVPPFNTYDTHTLDFLSDHNYDYLSAGWATPATDRDQHDIAIFPRTCNLKSARAVIGEAKKYKKLSPIINVVLHHDEFEEHIYAHDPRAKPPFTNLNELDSLLGMIKESSIMEIQSISTIAQILKGAKGHPHISYREWVNKLPWRFKHYFPSQLVLICPKIRVVFETVSLIAKRASD